MITLQTTHKDYMGYIHDGLDISNTVSLKSTPNQPTVTIQYHSTNRSLVISIEEDSWN
jgi:hypothetical protein